MSYVEMFDVDELYSPVMFKFPLIVISPVDPSMVIIVFGVPPVFTENKMSLSSDACDVRVPMPQRGCLFLSVCLLLLFLSIPGR